MKIEPQFPGFRLGLATLPVVPLKHFGKDKAKVIDDETIFKRNMVSLLYHLFFISVVC